MAAISMYLFKQGSRNAMNNERAEEKFKRNYENIFKIKFPHMDTVDKVMRLLNEKQLEKLKTELVKVLIKRKVFYKFRFLGKFYLVAVDGTHVMNVKESHCEHCLHSTSKKSGKVRFFHNVLEAKLVCGNGFCISLATEWIENEEDYDKQDCEQKAFVRLAKKLKRNYPQLPTCIIADALYPNQTFFNICSDYKWGWIVTFKDGNLPSVWKEVLCLKKFSKNIRKSRIIKDGKEIYHIYSWIDDIDYHGVNLNWFECVEEEKNSSNRFVYVSNFKVDYRNVLEMTTSGRMRWKIENEGFDIQKNHGYGLKHKYSRISMQATKNYYQCMQIAHMINQLLELGSLLQSLLSAKQTIMHLWKFMLGEMRHTILDIRELEECLRQRIQIRYG